MGLCYAQMGLHLYRGDKTILQLVLIPPAALNKSRQDKKRIVIMFAVVITIFIVCWAPYHLYFLLVYHLPSITQYQHIGNYRLHGNINCQAINGQQSKTVKDTDYCHYFTC